MLTKLNQATEFLKAFCTTPPQTGIILGTGLGALVNEIEIRHSIDYPEIPNFPVSTVESHKGRLILGTLAGKEVIVMQGRFHYYEGYSLQEVTFPVRVMIQLGIKQLFISNASGGLNPSYEISDLMVLDDHINLLPDHPLRGKNEPTLGPRFPDMSDAYDESLIKLAFEVAKEQQLKLQKGVYAAVQGPTLETKAEYKYLRVIGADAVGMSTVPENIVARHMGVPVFAISVITDLGVPNRIQETSLQDVINAAGIAEPRMTALIKGMISKL
ncbi:MAG: purine-nucleoside phosphorylase [Bacteroidetes bacterium]|nr:purine-nucleoside phosphorylase [Bacteroidota bacterium]